jgi:hypothetical protein
MKTMEIAAQIDEKERLLEEGRAKIMPAAAFKAEAIGNLKKKIALVTIRLKNGKPMTLDGETIENCPVTLINKIAEGFCWEEITQMELASGEYKGILAKMESVRAELNGLQSKNKWLESN